jgi:hypothetical protein
MAWIVDRLLAGGNQVPDTSQRALVTKGLAMAPASLVFMVEIEFSPRLAGSFDAGRGL